MIDLHSHTTHSDGQHTPAGLFDEARAAGVTVLAVTDHDTVAGLVECAAEAARVGLRLVPGIELSCELHGREVHVLGHLVDPASPALADLQRWMLEERRTRMARMVEKAKKAGLRVTFEQVVARSGGENLGRPHLARALVDAGHAESVKDAFARYLKSGALLYVEREKFTVANAVALLHRAGGTASLAHPGANKVSKQELKGLAALGLDAVEALHPEHVPNQVEAFERWAAELELLVTGGSDYHGPAVQPDRKLGARSLSPERFARLEERARTWRA